MNLLNSVRGEHNKAGSWCTIFGISAVKHSSARKSHLENKGYLSGIFLVIEVRHEIKGSGAALSCNS